MATVPQSIKLESVLESIFAYLPDMSFDEGGQEFSVSFGYGDEVELNGFLANREVSDTYPLVWMLYPQKEVHTKTNLVADDLNLILAVDTNSSDENKQRMALTFGKVLMPLLDNIRYAFKMANIINVNNEYSVVKHPNYSKTAARDENTVIAIWDALKVTFSITVKNTCLREFNF